MHLNISLLLLAHSKFSIPSTRFLYLNLNLLFFSCFNIKTAKIIKQQLTANANTEEALMSPGVSAVATWQQLTCSFEEPQEDLRRVWCRQSSPRCCSGLTFSPGARSVDHGKLEVTQGPDSFTVAVVEPSFGEGVYWCGVLSGNHTLIKLAEGYVHRCE